MPEQATLLELPRRKWILVREWMAYVGCSRSTVYRHAAEGRLTLYDINGQKRLLRENLVALEKQAKDAAGL